MVQLLDDILSFAKHDDAGGFYCLQPIVVRKTSANDKNDGAWEVLDGQQRITTLKIILKVLASEVIRRSICEEYGVPEFSVTYETRPRSASFLENITEDRSNIDFSHMWDAYQTIVRWFSDRDRHPNDKDKIKYHLLASVDDDRPVKVIWYEIDESADQVDVFTRLNIGKIPLTNAELVKALFLHNSRSSDERREQRQLQIASEWDQIEHSLQHESFWHFAYDRKNSPLRYTARNYETRIEYVLDLIAGRRREDEEYATFLHFLSRFDDMATAKEGSFPDHWMEIKKHYQVLEEWYDDPLLFHLVGFLVASGVGVPELIRASRDKYKSAFRRYLRQRIAEVIRFEEFETVSYETANRDLILRTLLFFNIALLIDDTAGTGRIQQRFPFDIYKDAGGGRAAAWDIEHVHSQTEGSLSGKERQWWASRMVEYFAGVSGIPDNARALKQELTKQLDNLTIGTLLDLRAGNSVGETDFKTAFERVQEEMGTYQIDAMHSMGNLALLDAGTNRAYKNAPFAIKRMEIIKRERNGLFVPLATKGVFLKAFSQRFADPMTWTQDDASDYERTMLSTIERVLTGKNDE